MKQVRKKKHLKERESIKERKATKTLKKTLLEPDIKDKNPFANKNNDNHLVCITTNFFLCRSQKRPGFIIKLAKCEATQIELDFPPKSRFLYVTFVYKYKAYAILSNLLNKMSNLHL